MHVYLYRVLCIFCLMTFLFVLSIQIFEYYLTREESLKQRCKELGINKSTFYSYKSQHPELTDDQIFEYYLTKEKSPKQKCKELELEIYNGIIFDAENDLKKYLKNVEENTNKKIIEYYSTYKIFYQKDFENRINAIIKDNFEILFKDQTNNEALRFKRCLTEILAEVNYLHKEGFPVVYAQHFVSNKASGRVMEKAKMKYEATLKSRVVNKNGKRENVKIYSSIVE